MLPTNMLNDATSAMRSLHDSVLSLEKRRLRENDVAYPVFVAKVPEGKGFVGSTIGRMIVLRFDDIFAMFNLHPLHYTFVRLFSLSMGMRIIRDKTPDIVIVDPSTCVQSSWVALGTSKSRVHTSKASFWRTQIRITSSCLTFPSKSSPHRPVTYDFLDFDRFFSNIPCFVQCHTLHTQPLKPEIFHGHVFRL